MKTAKYVMGFVVGYHLPGVKGASIFYVEEKVWEYNILNGQKIWQNRVETRVFKDPDEARKRAELGQRDSDARRASLGAQWFWRAYKYVTPNPENAKGMPTWEHTDEVWHWVNPRTSVEETITDASVLAKVLSRIW